MFRCHLTFLKSLHETFTEWQSSGSLRIGYAFFVELAILLLRKSIVIVILSVMGGVVIVDEAECAWVLTPCKDSVRDLLLWERSCLLTCQRIWRRLELIVWLNHVCQIVGLFRAHISTRTFNWQQLLGLDCQVLLLSHSCNVLLGHHINWCVEASVTVRYDRIGIVLLRDGFSISRSTNTVRYRVANRVKLTGHHGQVL